MQDAPGAEMPYHGARRTIDWARWPGAAETIEMWEGFDERLAGKFYARFARLSETGALVTPEQFRKLAEGDGIWEIKASGRGKYGNWRAACFQLGETWWITHFFKTSHKTAAVRAAAERAEQARREHMAAEGAKREP